MGFEPMIHFWRIHTFQACAFDHSAISPVSNVLNSNLLFIRVQKYKYFQMMSGIKEKSQSN